MATADPTRVTARAVQGGSLVIDNPFCPRTKNLSNLVKTQTTAEKPEPAVLIKSWKNPLEPATPNLIVLARFRCRNH